VRDQRWLPLALIPARAGPLPVGGLFNQAAPDGVEVNVFDHCTEGCRFLDVAIVTAARLPEQALGAASALACDLGQPRRRLFAEVLDARSADRFFDGRQDGVDLVDGLAGINDQVNVLGHEHVSPQSEVEGLAGLLDALDEPQAGPLSAQKAEASIA